MINCLVYEGGTIRAGLEAQESNQLNCTIRTRSAREFKMFCVRGGCLNLLLFMKSLPSVSCFHSQSLLKSTAERELCNNDKKICDF